MLSWMNVRWLSLVFALSASVAAGQDIVPPDSPLEEIVQQMKFDQPTRIVGRFRSVDAYEDAIWIDWTHRQDRSGWIPMRHDMMLKVFPRDAKMMDWFRALKAGISLHMTVQQDENGNRRILELEEA
jgi:hypothetical protein